MLKRETGYPSTWRMRKITSPQKDGFRHPYEDYDILVINKGPDIVVHPTKSHQEGPCPMV